MLDGDKAKAPPGSKLVTTNRQREYGSRSRGCAHGIRHEAIHDSVTDREKTILDCIDLTKTMASKEREEFVS